MNKKLESLEKRIDRKLKNFESLDEYFKEMDSQSVKM